MTRSNFFTRLGIVLFCLLAAQSADASSFVRLYILSGQSNMGIGSIPDPLTGTASDVWFDNSDPRTAVGSRQSEWLRVRMPSETPDSGDGIQAGAAEVFQARHPGDRIAILKVSQGSTGIGYWSRPGEAGYEALMERISAVRARLAAQVSAGTISGFSIEGFVWMQGEDEINAYAQDGAEDYYYSLVSLLSAVRNQAAAASLPASIGRTSWIFAPETLRPNNAALLGEGDLRPVNGPDRPYTLSNEFVNTGLPRGASLYQGLPLMVRNGQIFLDREPGIAAGWADSDDLPVTDYYHLVPGNSGAVTLGRRLGRELLRQQGDAVPAELTVHAGPHRWAHPGSVSFTPVLTGLNGESSTILWELVTGPASVTFTPSNALNPSVNLATPGTYALRVTATTPTRSHRHTVNVIVLPADQNLPAYGYADPLYVEAPLQRVPISATIINPDSDPLTYQWTRQLGSGLVTFENASALTTHARFHAAGSYTLRLALNDGTTRNDGNSSGWVLLPVTVGRANDAGFKTYAARFPFEETDFLLGETRVADNQQVNHNVTRSATARAGSGSGSFNGTSAYL